jgi:hypothetical protein
MVFSASDPLMSVSEVLTRAFPKGLPDNHYLALLRVLTEEMSFRSVSRVVAETFGLQPLTVLHDAYGVQSMEPPAEADVDAVRQLLRDAGDEALPDE